MAAIDPIHFQPLHKYFPELTLNQASIGILRAQGCSVSEIALLRGISESAVKKTLAATCQNMNVSSVSVMSTAIDVRIKINQATAIERLLDKLDAQTSTCPTNPA